MISVDSATQVAGLNEQSLKNILIVQALKIYNWWIAAKLHITILISPWYKVAHFKIIIMTKWTGVEGAEWLEVRWTGPTRTTQAKTLSQGP